MGMEGLLGLGKKPNVAAEQARLKSEQEVLARSERDKAAASAAAKENSAMATQAQEQSARAAFTNNILPDDSESRRKFLKKV